METQTLKITPPSGYEIDSCNIASGEITFREKPKVVTERIKTVDDVLKDHGLSREQFDKLTQGLEPDEASYILLKMITSSLNEDWTPDWNNSSEYKYAPYFDMRNGSSGFRFDDYAAWLSYSHVGSRLCFKTKPLAEHAAKHFIDVYRQFMVIENKNQTTTHNGKA